MLSDRFYMRDSGGPKNTTVVGWLVASIISAFVVELIFLTWFGAGASNLQSLGVTVANLQQGRVWTIFTYGFIHWNSSQNLLHVAAVLFGVVVFGQKLLPVLGSSRLLAIYAASLAAGALAWAAANWNRPEAELFGGMAAVYGLLTVYACLFPDEDFHFTLFFFPVTIRPKHLLLGLGLVELVAFVFYERFGAVKPFAYAPSAHLGGIAAGFAYFRFFHAPPRSLRPNPAEERPVLARQREPFTEPVSAVAPSIPPARDELRAEVDRILDKINSQGLNALTPAEKRALDQAKNHLSRR